MENNTFIAKMDNEKFQDALLALAIIAQNKGWDCTLAYLKNASQAHEWESNEKFRSTETHKMKESPVHVEEEKDPDESPR